MTNARSTRALSGRRSRARRPRACDLKRPLQLPSTAIPPLASRLTSVSQTRCPHSLGAWRVCCGKALTERTFQRHRPMFRYWPRRLTRRLRLSEGGVGWSEFRVFGDGEHMCLPTWLWHWENRCSSSKPTERTDIPLNRADTTALGMRRSGVRTFAELNCCAGGGGFLTDWRFDGWAN